MLRGESPRALPLQSQRGLFANSEAAAGELGSQGRDGASTRALGPQAGGRSQGGEGTAQGREELGLWEDGEASEAFAVC